VTVKDVFIPFRWRATPNVCSMETAHFNKPKILDND